MHRRISAFSLSFVSRRIFTFGSKPGALSLHGSRTAACHRTQVQLVAKRPTRWRIGGGLLLEVLVIVKADGVLHWLLFRRSSGHETGALQASEVFLRLDHNNMERVSPGVASETAGAARAGVVGTPPAVHRQVVQLSGCPARRVARPAGNFPVEAARNTCPPDHRLYLVNLSLWRKAISYRWQKSQMDLGYRGSHIHQYDQGARDEEKDHQEHARASDNPTRADRRRPGCCRRDDGAPVLPAGPEPQQQAEYRDDRLRRPGRREYERRWPPAAVRKAPRARRALPPVFAENITVLCDVNQNAVDAAARRFPKAKKYNDIRRVFDSPKDFDAVMVSTCEHTHTLATYLALSTANTSYCEKPLTHDVWEARLIRETPRNTRSSPRRRATRATPRRLAARSRS